MFNNESILPVFRNLARQRNFWRQKSLSSPGSSLMIETSSSLPTRRNSVCIFIRWFASIFNLEEDFLGYFHPNVFFINYISVHYSTAVYHIPIFVSRNTSTKWFVVSTKEQRVVLNDTVKVSIDEFLGLS